MHPLNGPQAKIRRAQCQLAALQTTLQQFFERYPYDVAVAEFDRRTGCYNLRVQGGPPAFPDEWGVLIGEIAHNLRSALDGLAWQLALLKTKTTILYEHTAFPICLAGRKSRRRKGGGTHRKFWYKDGCPLHLLRDIKRCFWTRIEAFQPYKRGNRGQHNPLFLLQELNNTDKHRLITVLATIVHGIQFTGLAGGGSKFKVGVALHANAKVGYVKPLPEGGVPVLDFANGRPKTRMQQEIQMKVDITPGVRFGDRCHAIKRLPVIPTLQSMSDEVSRVVESFARDF